jgi:hypothetical protein
MALQEDEIVDIHTNHMKFLGGLGKMLLPVWIRWKQCSLKSLPCAAHHRTHSQELSQ